MHDSAALTIEPGGVSPGQSALRSLTSKASNQGDGAASTITFILIDLHSLEICRSRSSEVLGRLHGPVHQMTQQRAVGEALALITIGIEIRKAEENRRGYLHLQTEKPSVYGENRLF